MRTRMPLAVLLVFVPAVALAQGHGRGPSSPHPRGHAGPPPAHGHARPAGTHGNSHGKAHGAASGKAHEGAAKTHGPKSAAAHLEVQPELRAQLQQRLPAGTNIDAAADGFGSLGQFVAAVNVSKNLNIPFDQLKPRITGDGAVPLGQAIHELRPDVDGGAEAARAERDANALIEGRR